VSDGELYPSFALQHVLSTLPLQDGPERLRVALLETMQGVLASIQRAGQQSIERAVLRQLESEPESIERLQDAASEAYEDAEMLAEEEDRVLDAQRVAKAIARDTSLEIDTRDLRGLEGRELEQAVMDQVDTLAQTRVRARLLAQVQARLGVPWQAPETLLTVDASTTEDAQRLLATILDSVTETLAPRQASLLREIERDIEAQIRQPDDCSRARVIRFLYQVRIGTRSGYDKQHRRVNRRFERLQYGPWVAEQIADWERQGLEQAILDHLEQAIHAWENAWADTELRRIGSRTLAELDQETQRGLKEVLGERAVELETIRVMDLQDPVRQALRRYLGRRVLLNVQRQLMLDATSHHWVDHLTEIEILRQGISLQSYAQKDPLAQYRIQAYETFQDLLRAIQAEIVTGMFTYRPRDLSQVRVGVERRKRVSSQTDAASSQGKRRKQRPKTQKPRKRRKRR
jgi:preprotein translocase subunit SecA